MLNPELISRCRQILAENEEVFEFLVTELVREDQGKPNTGATAFLMAKQTIESNGYQRGVAALLARIKKYAGKTTN